MSQKENIIDPRPALRLAEEKLIGQKPTCLDFARDLLCQPFDFSKNLHLPTVTKASIAQRISLCRKFVNLQEKYGGFAI